jgi:hypothetical protein
MPGEGVTAVGKRTEKKSAPSRVAWAGIEAMARAHVERYVQALLELEVEDALGRARYVGKSGVVLQPGRLRPDRRGPDLKPGCRNGRGRPRKLTLSCGAIGSANST